MIVHSMYFFLGSPVLIILLGLNMRMLCVDKFTYCRGQDSIKIVLEGFMKKLLYVLLAMTVAFAMVSCGGDDDPPPVVTPVTPPTVTSVTITDGPTNVEKGGTAELKYTAVVDGINLGADDTYKGVTWSVEAAAGTKHADTTITDGVLVVDGAESATSLIITATSDYDTSIEDTKTVYVHAVGTKVLETITITPVQVVAIVKGATLQFGVEITGLNITGADQGVTWSISPATGWAAGTTFANGLLTVADGETLTSLTLKATANLSGFTDRYAEKTLAIVSGFIVTFKPWAEYNGSFALEYFLQDGDTINLATGLTQLPTAPEKPGNFEFNKWVTDPTNASTEVTTDTPFISATTVYGYYLSTELTNTPAPAAGDFVEKVRLSNGARAIYKFILPKGAKYSDYDKIRVSFKVSEADLTHNLQNLRMYGLWSGGPLDRAWMNGNASQNILEEVDYGDFGNGTDPALVLDFNRINTSSNPTGRNFILDRQNNYSNAIMSSNAPNTWFTVEYDATGAGSNEGDGGRSLPASITERPGTLFYVGLGLAGNGRPMDPDHNRGNPYDVDFGITQLIKNVTLVPKSTAPATSTAVIAYGDGGDFAQFASYIDPGKDTTGYPSTREVLSGAGLVPAPITCTACTTCALNNETLESATWGNIFCTCDDNNDGTPGDCPNSCELCERIGPPKCLCPNGTVHLEACTCPGLDCVCTIAVCACDTHAGGSACGLRGKKFSEVTTEYCTCDTYCTTGCLVCRAVGPEPATAELVLLDSKGEYGSTAKGTALEADIPRPPANYPTLSDLNTAANNLIPAGFDIRKYTRFSIKIELSLAGVDVPIVYSQEITQVALNMGITGSKTYYSLGAIYDDTPGTGNATVNQKIEANAVGALTFNFQGRGGTQLALADHIKVTAIVFHVTP